LHISKKNNLKRLQPLKIALVGPESTGKSALTKQLSKHYKTPFVPEFARVYLDKLKYNYTLSDLILIAKRQLEMEEEIHKKSNSALFCDTNLLVLKIWALHAFHVCPSYIADNWKPQDYTLHLLMQVDLPWEPDPLREHPHLRKFFFDWYHRELMQANANFAIISGTETDRLKRAVSAIDQFLEDK
jgi:nicotinamide riboside kinase